MTLTLSHIDCSHTASSPPCESIILQAPPHANRSYASPLTLQAAPLPHCRGPTAPACYHTCLLPRVLPPTKMRRPNDNAPPQRECAAPTRISLQRTSKGGSELYRRASDLCALRWYGATTGESSQAVDICITLWQRREDAASCRAERGRRGLLRLPSPVGSAGHLLLQAWPACYEVVSLPPARA